jgi:hypothetical protein
LVIRILSLVLLVAVLSAQTVLGADKASGTFTVKGKTTIFNTVYASRQPDASDSSTTYLIVLLSDGQVATADRVPDKLLALAKAGRIRALRVVWTEGLDRVLVTPYHGQVDEIGQPVRGAAVIDLKRYDGKRLVAGLKSRMLGQDWHFNASMEADLAGGGPAVLEAVVEEPALKLPPSGGGDNPTELKRALGRLGYDYKPDTFVGAVGDGNVEAVSLFLRAGMPADTKGDNGYHALMFATMSCSRGEPERRVGVITTLVGAMANVNVRDDNGSTPLIWAAQQCPVEAVEALIKAGADVNARAKGGATPLMMASVMQKTDVVAALKRAGAK